jgi:hypothetical protein
VIDRGAECRHAARATAERQANHFEREGEKKYDEPGGDVS